ncbi:hypothetical protein CQA49_05975 [Helicobacter sp. MIT 00-7814]|nr:hypothetical protein CQA49_05975 [Helicobacter sp. MIT 00-7814]RDU57077.1 hypothetical protein CQA37_01335 [Helicobacter sp. MIT 99-10781]
MQTEILQSKEFKLRASVTQSRPLRGEKKALKKCSSAFLAFFLARETARLSPRKKKSAELL